MMKIEAMHAADLSDADLVAESRSGDREAFGRIVKRYQTLIVSLAYCATGDVSRSEDLAQDTFVSAWKQLADLREPDKLRPWLCSIARFLISKQFRRQGREPEHAAESLAAVDDWVSPEPLPAEQVISDEEKAILWRSLERIPEIYREPLVLFYREQQSIETVARDLGLTEDAVKQRLSRGRKLVQDQFLAFIAGALKQTTPGKSFTVGVIAALPVLVTTAKAATVGTLLAQSGSVAAKATTLGGLFQTGCKSLLGFAYWLAPILPVGGYVGYKMAGDRQHSERARRSVATFWRVIGWSMLLLVFLPPLVLALVSQVSHGVGTAFYHIGHVWLEFLIPALIYGVAPLSVVSWLWQRRRPDPSEDVGDEVAGRREQKSITIWVVLGMTGALACLVFLFWSAATIASGIARDPNLIPKTCYVSTAEAQELISHSTTSNLDLRLVQFRNGYSYLHGAVRESGKQYVIESPAEKGTLALLAEKGIPYGRRMEGRDFTFGIRMVLWLLGNWGMSLLMPAFCLFLLVAGAVTLLRKREHLTAEPRQVVGVRNEQRVDKVFATLAGCGMLALALFLGLITDWNVRRVGAGQLPGIIAQHKNARFEVFEYRNGSRELWVSNGRSPAFIAPANQSTLALLDRNGVTFQTYLADLDWWYRPRGIFAPPGVQPHPSGGGRLGLSQSAAASAILLLVAVAGGLLWWVAKRIQTKDQRL